MRKTWKAALAKFYDQLSIYKGQFHIRNGLIRTIDTDRCPLKVLYNLTSQPVYPPNLPLVLIVHAADNYMRDSDEIFTEAEVKECRQKMLNALGLEEASG